MSILEPEKLFDMSYAINKDLRAIANNKNDVLKGINLLKDNLLQEKNKVNKAKVLSKLGYYLKIIDEYIESEIYLNEAINIFKEENDEINLFITKIRLIQNIQYRGNLDKSLGQINILENELDYNLSLERYRDFIYQHKGKILFDLKNYSDALSYFNKALEIRIKKNDIELIESTKIAIQKTSYRL